MEQLTHFIMNHWILSATFAVIFILLMIEELKGKQGGDRLSPADVTHAINREKAVVVDIRDQESYASGHIVNAIHIPQDTLLASLNKLKKYQDKPVILVCNNGNNSSLMLSKLRKEGLSKVYCLAGGVQSWKVAGLPLTKS